MSIAMSLKACRFCGTEVHWPDDEPLKETICNVCVYDEYKRVRAAAAKWEAVEPYLLEADRRYTEAMEIGDTLAARQMYPYIANAMKAAALADGGVA